MRSLFFKIFLYFLLIILLVAGITVVLTYLRNQQFPSLANQDFAQRAVTEYGRDAIRAYENAGIRALDDYTDRVRRRTGILLALFDQYGEPLSAERQPHFRMSRIVKRALSSGELVMPNMGMHGMQSLATVIQADSGQTYVVALSLPDRPAPANIAKEVTHGFLGWQLLLLLIISALICFVLARSLTAPIGRLRQATRKFAAGDLSIRIGGQIKGSQELAGLAHDFDDMATKIEDLVAGQKQLLRDISHELRSPLARLGVALELARQQGKPETQAKALERIECEAERMNEMIGQLLSLTRLESGAAQYKFELFDLSGLLDRLVQDASYEAQKHNCRVELDAPDQVLLNGSEDLLAHAIENVIRNAVKYSAEQGVVRVSLRQQDAVVHISVDDQGPGVPEDSLDKLFEPFYRVADARDRQSGGTGIGLAIAKRAVVLHRGRIKAENHESGGLSVSMELPQNI